MAVDNGGGIVSSRTPAIAGSWHRVHADNRTLEGISCPIAGLCVAVDAKGNVLVTHDPLGGASAWTTFHVDEGVNYECFHDSQSGCAGSARPMAISCASADLCAESDDSGYVFWSQDAAAGSAAWTHSLGAPTPVSEGDDGIACPTSSLCVFVDSMGGAVASFDPATGTTSSPVVLGGDLSGVACPSARLCLAYGAGPRGDVDISSAPARGGWRAETVDPHARVWPLDCAPTLCVAVEGLDAVIGQPLPAPARLARELRGTLQRLTGEFRSEAPLSAIAPGPGRLTLTVSAGTTLLVRARASAAQAGRVRLRRAETRSPPPGARVTARLTYAPAGVPATAVSRVLRPS